jgi:hypothetical protein
MKIEQRVTINLANAECVANRKYTKLRCPNCEKDSSEAFFTAERNGERYGLWFKCVSCGNIEHLNYREMPAGFEQGRVNHEFQEIDNRAWKAENGGCTDPS